MIRQVFLRRGIGRAGAALAVLAGVVLTLGPALGGGKSDGEVKASVKADKAGGDGKQTIQLTLTINKGWYLYANPVGNEDFAANATTVTVTSKPKPQKVDVGYPPGKVKKDAVIGEYKIYEDQVTIPVRVQRPPGDTGALELSVRVNACNAKGFCLPPGTLKVTVP
jgi:thiol:disulfide interchange protein